MKIPCHPNLSIALLRYRLFGPGKFCLHVGKRAVRLFQIHAAGRHRFVPPPVKPQAADSSTQTSYLSLMSPTQTELEYALYTAQNDPCLTKKNAIQGPVPRFCRLSFPGEQADLIKGSLIDRYG
ncbi:MAG: hypothetical protein IT443_07690 [Phycisphaeraceae bacterium]|nr:hypothetical protein [Phycisphaeraceae bacterium]